MPEQAEPIWCVMPVLAHPDYTRAAIADVLAQIHPTRLLVVNQGVDDAFRRELEAIAEAEPERVLVWHHQPPLPSLSGTWNTALRFVWACGGEVALVVNNDVRLRPDTVAMLSTVQDNQVALFVSCVGVTPEDFDRTRQQDAIDLVGDLTSKGGPDFSCFLITRACHDAYPFDEGFTPAFCEDLDYHRRLLLAGEGARIFSINLPYLHYGSATLKTVDERQRDQINRAIVAGSRAYYARKWGGPVNAERYLQPFGGGWSTPALVDDGSATTPYLQAHPPPNPLHGIPNDGLALTGGPDDGYRGQHRHDFRHYDPATENFICPCGERCARATLTLEADRG